jgi:hypothetical protein
MNFELQIDNLHEDSEMLYGSIWQDLISLTTEMNINYEDLCFDSK